MVRFAWVYEATLGALRGPRVITVRGCALLAVGSVAGSLAVDNSLGRGVGSSLELAVALTIASGLVLVVGRFTVLRPSDRGQASPWLALGVFALAGLIRPFLAMALGMVVGVDIPLSPQRALQAMTASVVGLVVVALAIDVYDRHKQAIVELESEVDGLNRQRATSQATIDHVVATIDSSVVQVVRGRLVEALDEMKHALPGVTLGSELRDAAARLSEINEDYVRPMSHSLYDVPDAASAAADSALQDSHRHYFRPQLQDRLSELFLISPFHPVAMPLLMSVGSIFVAVSGIGWVAGSATVLVESIVLGCGLAASNQIMNFQRRKHMQAWPRGLVVFALVGLSCGASLAVAWLMATRFGTFEPAFAMEGLVWMLLIWLLLAGVTASYWQRVRAIGVLAATRDTRQWELDALNVELTDARERRGSYLHGKVQSRLTLIAVHLKRTAGQLDEGLASTQEASAAIDLAIKETELIISDIDQLLTSESATPDLAASLEAIRGAWVGIIDVTYSDEDLALRRAGESRAVGTVVAEVVAEAVTNAAKHGNARTMEVAFEDVAGTLVVRAADDGRGLSDPGLVPDSMSRILGPGGRRVLTRNPRGGTLLTVEIPLGILRAQD